MIRPVSFLPSRAWRMFLLRGVLLIALLATAANGFSEAYLANGYSVRAWQTEDGLPQNTVTSAAQTKDGYLWFGTSNGLARFDGKRFDSFNSSNTPEFGDRRVSNLFEDEGGALWIGHETGEITRFSEGRFENFSKAPGKESEKVIGIGSDSRGRLWAMRENGRLDSLDGGPGIASLISDDRPGVMNWTRGADGIWVLENGVAARLRNGTLEELSFGESRTDNYVLGIGASPSGGVWVLCDDQIRRWEDGKWVEDLGENPWPLRSLAYCLELRDGTLALGTNRYGLYLFYRDGRPSVHFDVENGLPQNWVRFLFEDREGTLWVGAGSSGLVSIHRSAFSVISTPEQLGSRTALSVAPGSDGSLWVGTDGSGLFHLESGEWTQYTSDDGLSNPHVASVVETTDGDVWAGNFWWGGPYLLKDGSFIRPASVDPSWSPALALYPIPGTKKLLVGNRNGLLELGEESFRWIVKSPEGSLDDVTSVVIDSEGSIWCGFARGGLARIRDDFVTLFGRAEGLSSEAIHCLFADSDGSLWIGTADAGLMRFKDGRFATINASQGLADNTVCYLLDDGSGHIWMSTYHGIQRVLKEELNQCADGLIPQVSGQIFNRDDGLPIEEFTGGRHGAGCKLTNGNLCFASSKGVVLVDSTRVVPNLLPPPVVAETLLVDGKRVQLSEGIAMSSLAPDHQRLEFQFTGLSYVAPSKVRFKYRLDGIDKDWVDAGAERVAFYSQLPSGDYQFRVIASNNDGVWNLDGASLAFSVAPFFWETWWFVAASLICALGLAALTARYVTGRRMERKIQEIEHQHEVERERARIAQDIHDDVGTSLSRIAMLSQPARIQLSSPDRAAAVLAGIYTTACDVTLALDEIVWAVNPRHDSLDSLANYMGKFAQEFLSSAKVRCRLDIPVDVQACPLTADVRHNLFLAFKEALNNAVKHAGASEVRVSLALSPGRFVVAINDNGRGLVEEESSASELPRISSGNGLKNMRERLERIGGRCEISSESGSGTTVSLVVELSGRVF